MKLSRLFGGVLVCGLIWWLADTGEIVAAIVVLAASTVFSLIRVEDRLNGIGEAVYRLQTAAEDLEEPEDDLL